MSLWSAYLCGQRLVLWSVCSHAPYLVLWSVFFVVSVCPCGQYVFLCPVFVWSLMCGSVFVYVNPAMNQVHFASLEDEDEDMYSGFNDFSANDMTQVRLA